MDMCLGPKDLDHEDDQLSSPPVHIVTEASQLPVEFLEPSSENQLIIGFDCEGVDLCRNGKLCIMQVQFGTFSLNSLYMNCIFIYMGSNERPLL